MTQHWTDVFPTRIKKILSLACQDAILNIKKEQVVLSIISGDILRTPGAGKQSIKELCDYFNLDVPTKLNYKNNPEIVYLIQAVVSTDLVTRKTVCEPLGYVTEQDTAKTLTQQASDEANKNRSVFSTDRSPKYNYVPMRRITKI